MNDVLRSIGRGLAGLLSFGGRSGRARFWHYAGFVILVTQLSGVAAILPVFARIQRYLVEHPEQTRISSGPGHYSIEIVGAAPAMGPVMAGTVKVTALVSAIAVALLAAAVARRLHDCDRRGYWGLLPLPFLAAAMLLMPKLFGNFTRVGTPDRTLFFGLFFNNLVYLGSPALLVYLLVGKGTPGSNRFGPPSD
jgi:uncharacterized membrane protein YhaH (DUF805 family)